MRMPGRGSELAPRNGGVAAAASPPQSIHTTPSCAGKAPQAAAGTCACTGTGAAGEAGSCARLSPRGLRAANEPSPRWPPRIASASTSRSSRPHTAGTRPFTADTVSFGDEAAPPPPPAPVGGATSPPRCHRHRRSSMGSWGLGALGGLGALWGLGAWRMTTCWTWHRSNSTTSTMLSRGQRPASSRTGAPGSKRAAGSRTLSHSRSRRAKSGAGSRARAHLRGERGRSRPEHHPEQGPWAAPRHTWFRRSLHPRRFSVHQYTPAPSRREPPGERPARAS